MLAHIWNLLAQRRARPGFRSRYGGLWTDRPDASEQLGEAERSGRLDEAAVQQLSHWIEDGYAALEGAVAPDLCDQMNAEFERVWSEADTRYRIELGGARQPLNPAARTRHTKLLDLYGHFDPALEVAFAPAIQEFLNTVFRRGALLFQSLNFEYGSEQPIHQDTAYVVVNPPMEMLAVWIALEDVRPGTGELFYYPGSHRFEEFRFASGARHWNPRRDGEAKRLRYEESLRDQARERGLEARTYWPKKGDALVWNADLAHGGLPIQKPGLTRRSFVCHYCPQGSRPYYFHQKRAHRTIRELRPGCEFASSNVDLRQR